MRSFALRTVVIERVTPMLDDGRYPVKREVGDTLDVEADIFKEGHDIIAAVLKIREKSEQGGREIPMTLVDNDRWKASVDLDKNTRYCYTIEAWSDTFATWRRDLEKKIGAGLNVDVELEEGRLLVESTARNANGRDRETLERMLESLSHMPTPGRIELMLSDHMRGVMHRWPDRSWACSYHRELEVVVDRVRARYGAWYEMFPRSQTNTPGRSATFKECEARLPYIAQMGFDVVYLVPIHPIGKINRKGPNNTLNPSPQDPGCPYAIGSDEGGHKAIHPDLGTLEDFRRFVAACRTLDMEVALDIAIQCAPDHPYVKEHPEWFVFRPDGSIKYAENPPKKYQDIVNVNFYGPHREALWNEWRDVMLFWVEQGVNIFRVDNPHTKPVQFWEWCIGEIQSRHPQVIFLSEAFTRPKMLKMLAKVGFSQSYTYFTWRNFKQELTDYLTELTQTEVAEYLRPNFFTNTPDILPPFLQTGGRPAFMIRLVLAATLSSTYGIYNGFELCEATAIPGTEEYANSEKYDFKVWDWDRPGNIREYITRVNQIRRENPALQELTNLRFWESSSDDVIFYSKRLGDNTVFIAVNLDPFETHETVLKFPLESLDILPDSKYQIEELLTGQKHLWEGSDHLVKLDPQQSPAVIYRLSKWHYQTYAEPCF